MKEKYWTICDECDGTGITEQEPTCHFGNVTHAPIRCGCENGKTFDWEQVHKDIETLKNKLKEQEQKEMQLLELAVRLCKEYKNQQSYETFKDYVIASELTTQLEEQIAELEELT